MDRLDELNKNVNEKGRLLSDCMLGQHICTVIGVGIGLAIFSQRRQIKNFFLPVFVGTAGDLFIGYTGPCRTQAEEFEAAKAALRQATPKKH
jgi:hypothetical protein